MGCDWMRATCDPTPTSQPSNRLTDYTWLLNCSPTHKFMTIFTPNSAKLRQIGNNFMIFIFFYFFQYLTNNRNLNQFVFFKGVNLGLLYVLTINCLVFVQTIVGAPCWPNNRKAHKKTTNKITSSSHGPKVKPASCSFPPLSLIITTTTTTTIVRPRFRRRRWTKECGSVRCLTLRGSEIQLQSPRCCCYYHASSAMQHNSNTTTPQQFKLSLRQLSSVCIRCTNTKLGSLLQKHRLQTVPTCQSAAGGEELNRK